MPCSRGQFAFVMTVGYLLLFAAPARAQLVITPTFTSNFTTFFGSNSAAAEASWISAANVFTSNFTNNATINITVDAVSGTSVFGQSDSFLYNLTYSDMYNALKNNVTSPSNVTAFNPGGSMSSTDPTGGQGSWFVTTAQAKALGINPGTTTDGTTTFGTGFSYTFSGTIAAGTYDFKAVAAHEISEVLGRQGLEGSTITGSQTYTNSYSLFDNFGYTGAGQKGLKGGPNNFFSIDNGTTLLKQFNDPTSNGLDSRDWAGGTNDAFNQFSNSGVTNSISAIDLQVMNVIGYTVVPEPTGILAMVAVSLGVLHLRNRRKAVQVAA